MGSVLGIGGVFFKCRDRTALADWYRRHLDFKIGEYGGTEFQPANLPSGAYCVWGPFEVGTHYFDPSDKPFMINLIVDDVDAVLARAAGGGAEIVGDIEDHSYGRFGWFVDPEGNKIELWQPVP